MQRLNTRRAVVVVALAIAPIAVLGWTGCSEDEPAPIGMTFVDPGGTFGAEVAVTVVGRGRVTGSIANGIDCPTRCYARYTFADPTAPAAAAGLGLTAVATPGVRFLGWSFENEQLGTKGRGPDSCNPIKRATAQPAVDTNAAQIQLSFGETTGAPPAGQEGACGANFTTVPLAYKIVARFEDIPIPDAGIDAPPDAGPGELLYEQPVVGATGGDLGIIGGRLYWRYTSGGFQGIASGTTSAITMTPQVVVSATTTIPLFEVDTYSPNNVVYQKGDNSLGVLSGASVFPTTGFLDIPGQCNAVESYSSVVYCLAAGTLYSWPNSGGNATVVLGGVPVSDKNFVADASYFFFVDDTGGAGSSTITRMLKSSADGDAGTFTPIVTGQTNPIKLQRSYSSSYIHWIQYDTVSTLGELRSSSIAGGTVYTSIPAQNGLRLLHPDTSSSYVYGGVVPAGGQNCSIIRGSTFGGIATPIVTGITNLTGLAVDSTYVYWTQNDGRVYRRPKN